MRQRGIFIVLEGSDGSGKTTQFNLLAERLKAIGYDVAVFDFPRYDKGSGHFVKQYLNGAYGSATEISPYTASLFFALDRYEASKDIEKALAEGKVVLSNRYTGSNMAHQGSKFGDEVEQRGFFIWADNLEYHLLGIPRPDISIFLRVPADVSYELIKRKRGRSYTDKVHDEHEADIDHLKNSVATYDLLCRLFPKDFRAIECTKHGQLMSVAEINNLIWESLKPILPPEKPNPSHSVVVSLGAADDQTAAPAPSNGGELIFPFKQDSLLLKLQLERFLPGCTGSASGGWSQTEYDFYTPRGLPKALSEKYKQSFKRLAEHQQALRQNLSQYLEKSLLRSQSDNRQSLDDLLLPLTPLGALTSFQVSLQKRDVSAVGSYLLDQETAETQWAGQQLYLAARQKWPKDFKGSLEAYRRPEPINQIIDKLAAEHLSDRHSDSEVIKLLEARPRQEFDLLAETFYPFSSLSLADITEEIANWPYQQKYQSLRHAAALPELLDKVDYRLDLITDQIVIGRLSAALELRDVLVQVLTPRYGYDVPSLVEAAGLSDSYDECFDISLQLYSSLQAAGLEDLAAYATLMGHKARWQLRTSARQLQAIIGLRAGQPLAAIAGIIYENVSEVHPLLWEVITGQGTPAAKPKPGKTRVKPSHQRPKRRRNS